MDNSRAYVLDDGLQPVGERQVGSLYVSSRNLGRGYVGDKQGSFLKNHLNDSGEVDHILLYKTGDYVQVNQGRLYYEGRLDSQVKVRGHRVDLIEIEKAVREVEGVTITYKELNEKANRVARTLLGRIKNGGVKTNTDGDYIVAVR